MEEISASLLMKLDISVMNCKDSSDLLMGSFTGLCALYVQYEHLSLCIHSQTDTPAVLDYSLAGQTLPQLTPIG